MNKSRGQKTVSKELAEAAVENLKAGRYFEYVPGKNNDRQGDFTIKLHCQSIKQLWMNIRKNNKTVVNLLITCCNKLVVIWENYNIHNKLVVICENYNIRML